MYRKLNILSGVFKGAENVKSHLGWTYADQANRFRISRISVRKNPSGPAQVSSSRSNVERKLSPTLLFFVWR